jgi:hypothetical protein
MRRLRANRSFAVPAGIHRCGAFGAFRLLGGASGCVGGRAQLVDGVREQTVFDLGYVEVAKVVDEIAPRVVESASLTES